MKQLQYDVEKEYEFEDDSEDENAVSMAPVRREPLIPGGTLIIAPASLLKQWEMEIDLKVKRGALDVTLFHGPKRIYKVKELAKYDVVITSYGTSTIGSEYKNEGIVYKIKFRRIFLDERHVISRNHETQQSKAVCELKAERRWILSGTVQCKEDDAMMKFLRCLSKVDDSILQSIMLRRSLEQIIDSNNGISSLP